MKEEKTGRPEIMRPEQFAKEMQCESPPPLNECTGIKPLVIAIDFDGTVVTHDFPEVGRDIGAVPVLKRLIAAGHKLILYTMRSNCENNTEGSIEVPHVLNGPFLDDAVNWFKENGIELHAIQTNPQQKTWTSSPKCYAQLYIDDAALGVPLVYPIGELPETEVGNQIYLKHQRPYVAWSLVEEWLIKNDILPMRIKDIVMLEP